MPLPAIAAGLRALGGIYMRWRAGKFAADATGISGAVNNAVSVTTEMPGSRAIEVIAYNAVTARMDVTFVGRRGAGTYTFSSVPRLTWVGWLASKGGSYYHRHVKQYSDR